MANNFPTIKPSLNLQFANTGALPPDVTFTRASSSGGYYDGVTVAKAEENLLLHSEDVSQSVWTTNVSSKTLVSGTNPVGQTQNISQVTASGDNRGIQQAYAGTGTFTLSVWLRSVSGSNVVNVRLNGINETAFTITSDWDRYTVTGTGTLTDIRFRAQTSGDVFEFWGAQLEQRSSVTAYTPTTTQPITNFVPKLLFAPANVPVFDHNPVTGEALGLSVWESRTNELPYSEDYVTGVWGESRVSLSDAGVIDVRGGLNSVKMTENTENNSHFLAVPRPGNVTSGVTYTISVYLKANNSRYVQLTGGRVSSTTYANFDLVDGVVAASGSGTVSAIESVGNGWFRCSVRMPVISTGPAALNVCLTGDNPSATRYPSYEGDGISSVIVFGPQWETGAFATPYIPTVASAVTRSADAAVMTGANFSRWYRADEGTLVAEYTNVGGSTSVVSANDGTTSNRINFITRPSTASASDEFAVVVTGAVGQAALNAISYTTQGKNAISYKFNDIAATMNGAAVITDTSAIIPAVNRLSFGSAAVTVGSVYIRSFSYYPARLTNDNLVAVTQ